MSKERQQAIRDEREAEERYTQQGYQAEHIHHLLHAIGEKLDHLLKHQHHLEKQIMATFQEVKDAMAALVVTIGEEKAEIATKIQALIDQIAAGGGAATAAQLDEIVVALQGIASNVRDISEPALPT